MILRLGASIILLVGCVNCLQVRAEDNDEGVARSMELLQNYAGLAFLSDCFANFCWNPNFALFATRF